jgi:hypothetical protein
LFVRAVAFVAILGQDRLDITQVIHRLGCHERRCQE